MKKSYIYLLAIFLAPPIISLGVFVYKTQFENDSDTINYGLLVEPIENYSNIINLAKIKEQEAKWSYLIINEQCTTSCLNTIALIHTMIVLLNDDSTRVQLINMSNNKLSNNFIRNKKRILEIDYKQELADKLSSALKNLNIKSIAGLFLFDPQNNLVLYYDLNNLEGKKALSDIKRLLKYSRIG